MRRKAAQEESESDTVGSLPLYFGRRRSFSNYSATSRDFLPKIPRRGRIDQKYIIDARADQIKFVILYQHMLK
jgi:hypothetical protein